MGTVLLNFQEDIISGAQQPRPIFAVARRAPPPFLTHPRWEP